MYIIAPLLKPKIVEISPLLQSRRYFLATKLSPKESKFNKNTKKYRNSETYDFLRNLQSYHINAQNLLDPHLLWILSQILAGVFGQGVKLCDHDFAVMNIIISISLSFFGILFSPVNLFDNNRFIPSTT